MGLFQLHNTVLDDALKQTKSIHIEALRALLATRGLTAGKTP
jgi:hypothetical protein